MRNWIFTLIEKSSGNDKASRFYDIAMLVIIFTSLLPLAFKTDTQLLIIIDKFTAVCFIIDYILRWTTSDFHFNEKGIKPFIKYPFSLMAIIDLLSILPSLTIINKGFKVLRVIRMIRAARVLRIMKVVRYSKSFEIIERVIRSSKTSLLAVCTLAIGYILTSALLIFNVEPESFETFFDAIYWATVSLTTVGYGDIYPVTTIGRIVTMFSSIFGIAIVALPAGIITAGYMSEIEKNTKNKQD